MLIGLANEMLTLTADILEGVILALVGVKPSRRTHTRAKAWQTRPYTKRERQTRVTLNDRALQRLAGRLFENLPRDVAISVLNDVKRYGMEA